MEQEIPQFWPPDDKYPFPFNVRNAIELLRYLRGYQEIDVTGYSAAVLKIQQNVDANGQPLNDQLLVEVAKDSGGGLQDPDDDGRILFLYGLDDAVDAAGNPISEIEGGHVIFSVSDLGAS
jgi:hypothetical protein